MTTTARSTTPLSSVEAIRTASAPMTDEQLAMSLSAAQLRALSALASGEVLVEHWGAFEPHVFLDGKTIRTGRSIAVDEVRALARVLPEITPLWAEPGETSAGAKVLRLPASHRNRFLDVVQGVMPKPQCLLDEEVVYERPRMAA